jgi:hypothetical protein
MVGSCRLIGSELQVLIGGGQETCGALVKGVSAA